MSTGADAAAPGGDPASALRAAGGVIWRAAPSGDLEVVLVHRSRYDDWSLPKGKVEGDETDEEAALREVQEESTVVGRLGPELPSTSYIDHDGRAKVVRYWAMTVDAGEPSGSHEVDRAEWVALAAARDRLSYERDVAVLDALPGVLRSLPDQGAGPGASPPDERVR